MSDAKPVQYAVVELFGHARIAGAISEQTFGGASLVRVDVPEIRFVETDYDAPRDAEGNYTKRERVIQAHTRSFGGGAIYAINWCDQAAAVAAAIAIRDEPVQPYSVAKALAGMPDAQRLLGRSSVVDDDQG